MIQEHKLKGNKWHILMLTIVLFWCYNHSIDAQNSSASKNYEQLIENFQLKLKAEKASSNYNGEEINGYYFNDSSIGFSNNAKHISIEALHIAWNAIKKFVENSKKEGEMFSKTEYIFKINYNTFELTKNPAYEPYKKRTMPSSSNF